MFEPWIQADAKREILNGEEDFFCGVFFINFYVGRDKSLKPMEMKRADRHLSLQEFFSALDNEVIKLCWKENFIKIEGEGTNGNDNAKD